ncbi:hypothetical protein cyc_08986 [Cyclospora cayetanensis]|uniref:Uncharacterized protein n=1 Tax=Cyclospora cayetanensis TaxID=88456 RepID=A0A1D3D3N3_9EIME|nr:hypothetical protein cyc_08986 [Cyclospora cayetanensis]
MSAWAAVDGEQEAAAGVPHSANLTMHWHRCLDYQPGEAGGIVEQFYHQSLRVMQPPLPLPVMLPRMLPKDARQKALRLLQAAVTKSILQQHQLQRVL